MLQQIRTDVAEGADERIVDRDLHGNVGRPDHNIDERPEGFSGVAYLNDNNHALPRVFGAFETADERVIRLTTVPLRPPNPAEDYSHSVTSQAAPVHRYPAARRLLRQAESAARIRAHTARAPVRPFMCYHSSRWRTNTSRSLFSWR